MGWKETAERCHGFRRAVWAWLGRNWMWVAGGVTLALSLCLLYPAYLDYLVVVEEKDRVEALRNLALAGAALIGGSWGFILAIWRTRSQQQAADAASNQVVSTEQKLVSETFASAIELLGSESLAQRLGAIHTLGRLAHQNQDLHLPIMELLTSFIREHAPWPLKEGETSPEKPRADIQEAVKVLGRRNVAFDPGGFRLDLRNCNLCGVEIIELNLLNAKLRSTNFTSSTIVFSNISTKYGTAIFNEAHIESSSFQNSRLHASFLGALFDHVDFSNSFLSGDFTGSWFVDYGVGNNVCNADLSQWKNVEDRSFTDILYNDKTIWPKGFKPPSKDVPAS